MNLKIELFKGCIFILIGAYLCARFMPTPKPEVVVKQEQSQKCVAKFIKRQNPDGSKDEIMEFLAESSQKTAVILPKSKNDLLGLSATLFSSKEFDLGYKILEGEFLNKRFEVDAVGKIDRVDDFKSEKTIGLRLRL